MKLSTSALTAVVLSFTLAGPAQAGFAACDGKDGAKLEKCEAKEIKNVGKLRAKTTAYKPSELDKAFEALDGDDVNPFNTDYHYFGVAEVKIEKLAELNASVNKVASAVRMANYIGELNATDASAAQDLGGKLLPILKALDEDIKSLTEQAQALAGSPNDLVSSPMEVPAAVAATAKMISQLGATAASLPGALTAIVPIAQGAATAAVEQAVGDATEAAGDAVKAVTDKVDVPTPGK